MVKELNCFEIAENLKFQLAIRAEFELETTAYFSASLPPIGEHVLFIV